MDYGSTPPRLLVFGFEQISPRRQRAHLAAQAQVPNGQALELPGDGLL